MRHFGRPTHFLEGSTFDTEGNVVKDRSIEEDGFLIDIAHQVAQVTYSHLTYVRAIDGDAPLDDVIEARDEVDQGALP